MTSPKPAAVVDLDDARDTIINAMNADDRQTRAEYQAGCAALNALIAELEQLRAGAPKWIACVELMPEPTRRVLVYSPTKLEPFEAFHMPDFALSHRWQYRNGSYCAEDEVTHWMTLSVAPPEAMKP